MSDIQLYKSTDITKLPEGVIAELLYWCKHRDLYVNFVNISSYHSNNHLQLTPSALNYLHPLQKKGIEKILDTDIFSLRPTVYLAAGEKHAKHSDWLRKDAYNNHRVPLCPYTLFNKSTLDFAFDKNELNKLLARVSLSIKADEIWIYGIYKCDELEFSKLELDLLLEVYLTLKLKKVPITYKYFGEIDIPKYSNNKQWAITEYERVYHKN